MRLAVEHASVKGQKEEDKGRERGVKPAVVNNGEHCLQGVQFQNGGVDSTCPSNKLVSDSNQSFFRYSCGRRRYSSLWSWSTSSRSISLTLVSSRERCPACSSSRSPWGRWRSFSSSPRSSHSRQHWPQRSTNTLSRSRSSRVKSTQGGLFILHLQSRAEQIPVAAVAAACARHDELRHAPHGRQRRRSRRTGSAQAPRRPQVGVPARG